MHEMKVDSVGAFVWQSPIGTEEYRRWAIAIPPKIF